MSTDEVHQWAGFCLDFNFCGGKICVRQHLPYVCVFFCTSCHVFYCTCYFTSLIRLVREIICTVFCHIWLLHQISQIHHLSCIISYLCFVSRQSGQRYYLKCILSYTCFTRSGSGKWPAAYSVIRVCYTRLVRDTTCPVFYHTCIFVSRQMGQRHYLSCILSYLRFCFTPAWSKTPPVLCSIIPAFLFHTSWVRDTTCSVQGSARAPWCPLCWSAFTWPTWRPDTCLC